MPYQIVTALLAGYTIAYAVHDNRGPSRLTRNSSELATLCYAFQGMPDTSIDLEYFYPSHEHLKFEDYLFRILNHPSQKERPLSEMLSIMATNFYVDAKGKPILVTSASEANRFVGILTAFNSNDLTWQDKLAVQMLNAYYSKAQSQKRSTVCSHNLNDRRGQAVKINVQSIEKCLVIAESPDPNWSHPRLSR